MTERAIGDPSDKPTDAAADGQFQPANRRVGYGTDDERMLRIIAAAEHGFTLAAGEGAMLVSKLYALEDALEDAVKEAAAWKRRFWTVSGESEFVQKRPERVPETWGHPEYEWRVADLNISDYRYGCTVEEAVDALADFWDEYDRSCKAALDERVRAAEYSEPIVFTDDNGNPITTI